MSWRGFVAAAALLLAASTPASAAAPLLDALFQDHAVLQRGRPIPVWGAAKPGAAVAVTLANVSARATAGADGHWHASLPELPAGGPYVLTATDDAGDSQSANDILVGDDYLCAGQSNMALGVKFTVNAQTEIDNSANDSIRLLTVPREIRAAPLDAFPKPVQWQAASPQTVPDFSAACFYFARELQKSVAVPLGLINASWDGANIRTWMSEGAVRAIGGRDADLGVLALYRSDPAAATQRWGAMWEDWWRTHAPGSEPWSETRDVSDWQTAPAALGHWDDWNIPALTGFTGQVWYRSTVNVTAAQAAQGADLSLGAINEEDETWVNGKVVGNTFGYGTDRVYHVAPGVLHEGVNSVTVNILCTYKGCGLFGSPDKRALIFADGSRVPLSSPWRYKVVTPGLGPVPRAPWGAVAGLGMTYNAMIAPLHDFALRGVVWYQGESNTGEPKTYAPLLRGMMADWRNRFGADLPFLIVQLPGYGKPPLVPEESGWAELREAQREAAAGDPHAALIVTIDIGEHCNLHPANKQDVGRRLARAARHLIYGDPIVPSGPVAQQAVRRGAEITVSFADVENGLAAYSATTPTGFELCNAAACRFATARIVRDTVAVDVPKGLAPTHLRYCWADDPVCTLVDGARLPAGPFDLPIGGQPGLVL
jgi:sialate O-acetylesterase